MKEGPATPGRETAPRGLSGKPPARGLYVRGRSRDPRVTAQDSERVAPALHEAEDERGEEHEQRDAVRAHLQFTPPTGLTQTVTGAGTVMSTGGRGGGLGR